MQHLNPIMEAISKFGIIGTYWFENKNESGSNGEYGTLCGSSEEDENESGSNGEYGTLCGSSEEVLRKTKMKVAQTVNTERYVAVLRKFYGHYSYRAGQPPHIKSHSWLAERAIWKRLISSKCDIVWAPHSPNLPSPPRFLSVGISEG